MDRAGFKIDGAISLSIGAIEGKRFSEGALSLVLPPAFSLFGGSRPSGRTALRADNDNDPVLDQLKITVPEAYLGPVRFTDLSFEYRLRGGIDGDTNPGTSCTRKEWKARGNIYISGGDKGEAGFKLTPPPSQIAAHEPPPAVSRSGLPVHRTLHSLPAPVPGGGR